MTTGRALLAVGALTAMLLAATAGWVASSAPDGLERVAIDQGFSDRAEPPRGGVLPDYSVPGIGRGALSTAAAGVIGVMATLLVTYSIGLLLRRRGTAAPDEAPPRGHA